MTESGARRLGFLLWGDRPFMPGVKVTLELAEALAASGSEVHGWLVQGGPLALEEARRRLGREAVEEVSDLRSLPEQVRAWKPEVLYSKDHIDSVRALLDVRSQSGSAVVAFTSGFHALETLRPPTPTEVARGRPKPGVRQYLPFSRSVKEYRKLLRSLDGVVAISLHAEMLLELLYGVRPLGVVYPAVDPAVYTPPPPSDPRKGILVFVGPSVNRPPSEFLPVLQALPVEAGPLHLFGSAEATQELQATLGAPRSVRHVDLPGPELVQLYRRVRVTYITSEWEGFGYVGPESLLCGTPTVAEVAQPWMELTRSSDAVRIATGTSRLLDALARPPPTPSPSMERHRRELTEVLAPATVAAAYLRAISGVGTRVGPH